jgi:hypothetical protein
MYTHEKGKSHGPHFMGEFKEPSPEAELRPADSPEVKEHFAELRELGAEIRRVPEPDDALSEVARQKLDEYIRLRPEMVEDYEFWKLWHDRGNKNLSRSQTGRIREIKIKSEDRTISISEEVAKRVDDVYSRLKAEAAPGVIERLQKEPFIAEDGRVRSLERCELCGEEWARGARHIYRNLSDNPMEFTYDAEWSRLKADHEAMRDDGTWEPNSESRSIHYSAIHKLEHHPETAKVSLKEWKEFMTPDEKEFVKEAVKRRLVRSVAEYIAERICLDQRQLEVLGVHLSEDEIMHGMKDSLPKKGKADKEYFWSGALNIERAAEVLVENRMGKPSKQDEVDDWSGYTNLFYPVIPIRPR